MRTLNPDVVRVEGEGVSPLNPVPLEGLQVKLGHYGVAVVGVEDVHIRRTKAGALIHPLRGAVRPILDLVQVRLGGAVREIVLGMVEYVHGRLSHIPCPLRGGDQISR